MLPRRSPDANADGILRGGNIMIKVKHTAFGKSKTDPNAKARKEMPAVNIGQSIPSNPQTTGRPREATCLRQGDC